MAVSSQPDGVSPRPLCEQGSGHLPPPHPTPPLSHGFVSSSYPSHLGVQAEAPLPLGNPPTLGLYRIYLRSMREVWSRGGPQGTEGPCQLCDFVPTPVLKGQIDILTGLFNVIVSAVTFQELAQAGLRVEGGSAERKFLSASVAFGGHASCLPRQDRGTLNIGPGAGQPCGGAVPRKWLSSPTLPNTPFPPFI